MVGNTNASTEGAVGLTLGRLAQIPVQRNIGRVIDGGLPGLTSASFTDGSDLSDLSGTNQDNLNDKGYIFFRQFINKSGFYYNDDPSATVATDDFREIRLNRTINKAVVLTYLTFVEEILNEVQVNADGTLNATKVKQLQGDIENVIAQTMLANLEISNVRAFIDPNQNILVTNKLVVDLFITPVGVIKEIEVNLGFENPAQTT